MTENKAAAPHGEPEMKGWLNKWTNYLKGYQKRWFVLSSGLLSYYRNQAEMAHTCRGSISLHGAVIHTEDSCNFVISNGGTQTFHLKASSEVERQRWVTALELAKVKAIRAMESDDEEEMEEVPGHTEKSELQGVLKVLGSKLEDLQTCTDLIVKHGTALQRSLSELESLDDAHEAASKIKAVNERATLFRITATAMINACSDYLSLAQSQGRKWLRVLQHEHDQRMRLEEMVEQLARQHSHLEMAAQHHQKTTHMNHSDEDDDSSEFFDAMETTEGFTVTVPIGSHRRTSSGISTCSQASEGGAPCQDMHGEVSGSSSEVEDAGEATVRVIPAKQKGAVGLLNVAASNSANSAALSTKGSSSATNDSYSSTVSVMRRKRRTKVPDKPNYPLNLWSIMKNCIGKDLTKIPMPVNFSEPLSMLQRLTEDYEYSDILDQAASCDDPCEQLAYVAAFTVSSYATTSVRTGKPFNPLLGETYECDRTDDLGWRVVSEQVSHHPPVAAQYCEGRGWKCWQEFSMSSKFRGKYLQVIPLGIAHLTFDRSGNHYTWRKVSTTVHNIIVGKLWVDQSGEMDIVNYLTGHQCHLKFIPYSYFNRDVQRKVTGCVVDKDGNVKWVLTGTWDNRMEAAEVLSSSGDAEKGNSVLETGPHRMLWKRVYPPPESERYYNFTVLAAQLNEKEDGVAPTDCRHRPDQRLMEEGRWDEANSEKVRLEEKQRAARKRREMEAEVAANEGRPYAQYEPLWFRKEKDPMTGNVIHVYQGQYWACKEKQDWSRCPDIY